MHILVSTGIFPNQADPTRGIYIYKQVEALSRRCGVSVISPIAKYPFGIRGGQGPGAESVIDGIRVHHPRYPVLPGLRAMHGISLAYATLPYHRRLIAQARPDVILSFFAYPYGFAAAIIGRRLGIPVMIGTLGSDVNVKAKRAVERPMIRWALGGAARVLSVSRALDREVAALGVPDAKRAVVPNGIDGARFRPMPARDVRSRLGIDGEARVVTCVSRLSHEKGIDVLLRAAAKMHERAAQFFIVGDGPRRGDLVELARELGVEERVTFVGMKPHEEVPLWIAAGDVLALPSRIEGHPNAVLEALACGRPVVGTRVGGVAEAIRSEAVGMLVESESPEGMARALDEALAREWDTEAIAAVGGARTWDHVAGELLDLVSAVTGENS